LLKTIEILSVRSFGRMIDRSSQR